MGRGALRLARLEAGIWRSLVLWIARRVPGRSPDTAAFPYAREVTPLLLAFVWGSLLEIVIVHLLLPWETVRLIALVLGIWGLLWMLGLLASMRVHQHLVGPTGLLIRSGTTVELLLPWDAVEDIRIERGRVSKDPAQRDPAEAVIDMVKQTRLTVDLRRPVAFDGREVTRVRFFADDPKALIAAVRPHLAPPRAPHRSSGERRPDVGDPMHAERLRLLPGGHRRTR